MPLYLGLDSSTQSLTAIVLDADPGGARRDIVFETSLPFDEALPQYGTRHGVLPDADPAVAVSSPLMWAAALDAVMDRVARSGLDLRRLAAISGCGQQHGSVYTNASAAGTLARLDAARPLEAQLTSIFSRQVAPIWMDTSTACECGELSTAVGGSSTLTRRTGSRAFERFTGPQIRKFFKRDPAGYADTDRIHLVSSFMASLLVGGHAPLDPGDASGTNLMDIETGQWWPAAVDATAPGLASKLTPIVPATTIVGQLSPYWQARHGLPPARIVVWTGDNPSSLVGTGLVREGVVAISLGTSDTIFGLMREPRVDVSGAGHVFGAPTGDYMGLTCFRNGSLARERVRDTFGLTWDEFSRTLDATPAGNGGRLLLPWFEPEITPSVPAPGLRRYDLAADDGAGHVRGVVEAQMMALATHSRWMDVDVAEIYATGGAAANRAILQVMADVFGAEVCEFEVRHSASLGAALRALHADALADGRALDWPDVVRGVADPRAAGRVRPNRAHHALYENLMAAYTSFERAALADATVRDWSSATLPLPRSPEWR